MWLMKCSMMLGFHLFISLSPAAHTVVSPGCPVPLCPTLTVWQPHLGAVRPSSVASEPLGAVYKSTLGLQGGVCFLHSSLSGVKREMLKNGAAVRTEESSLLMSFSSR